MWTPGNSVQRSFLLQASRHPPDRCIENPKGLSPPAQDDPERTPASRAGVMRLDSKLAEETGDTFGHFYIKQPHSEYPELLKPLSESRESAWPRG